MSYTQKTYTKMKAKLIKTAPESYHMGHYFLNDVDEFAIGSTDYEWCRRVYSIKPQYKLSKQNCDEIFGVVDIDKLATEYYKEYDNLPVIRYNSYTAGFNKAMELNKDKVFTLRDVKQAIFNFANYDRKTISELDRMDMAIASIQQPTEIDVEIMMEYVGKCDGNNDNGCFQDSSGHNCGCFNKQPKIDSENCLILRKI
jgi:hypothetical protein